jgi:hypothetical protein
VDTSAKKLNLTPACFDFRQFSRYVEVGGTKLSVGRAACMRNRTFPLRRERRGSIRLLTGGADWSIDLSEE